MKKHYAFFPSYKKIDQFWVILFFSILISIGSCKKDVSHDNIEETAKISSLKLWYTNAIKQNTDLGFTSSFIPNWDDVYQSNENESIVYEIACTNPDKVVNSNNGNLTDEEKEKQYAQTTVKLLIFVNAVGNTHAAYMLTNGSSTKKEDLHYRDIKNFTGNVMFFNFNSVFANGWKYIDGKINSSINVAVNGNDNQLNLAQPKSLASKGKAMVAEAVDCYTTAYPIYQQQCITIEPIPETGQNFQPYTSCIYVMVDVIYTVTCTYNGGGEGGGGYNGGGSGGGGGGTGSPPTDPASNPDDPCVKKAKLASIAANTKVAAQNTEIKNKTAPNSNEYGAEQNLVSPNATSDYKAMLVKTDTQTGSFQANFTWNATNGYTIGVSHGHPGSSAPSPDDVFWMIDNLLNNQSLLAASTTDKNFYRQNVSVTVISANGTKYVVTVKDWGALGAAFATFNNNRTAYDASYSKLASDNFNSTEYALLSKLGNAINLFKADASSNEFKPLQIGIDNKVAPKPCPGENVE